MLNGHPHYARTRNKDRI